jgi:hypothetical protein
MKITELIDELELQLKQHGDIDVVSDSADGCLPVVVEGVREVVDDDDNESKALLMHGLESVEYEPDEGVSFEEARKLDTAEPHINWTEEDLEVAQFVRNVPPWIGARRIALVRRDDLVDRARAEGVLDSDDDSHHDEGSAPTVRYDSSRPPGGG